jgi:four helix bundle protein
MGARHFQDLIAWQLGFRLQSWILEFSRRTPVHRDRKYRDQLTDAGSGICRNVAEGFARWTHRDFHNSLRIAMTCHKEVESLLNEAVVRRFLTAEERKQVGPLIGRCGKAISRLMKSLRERPDFDEPCRRETRARRRSRGSQAPSTPTKQAHPRRGSTPEKDAGDG